MKGVARIRCEGNEKTSVKSVSLKKRIVSGNSEIGYAKWK